MSGAVRAGAALARYVGVVSMRIGSGILQWRHTVYLKGVTG